MMITKLRNKTVITDSDLNYNQRLGMPIEVFCLESNQTIAFGMIQHYNELYVCVNGQFYSRDKFVLFGCPVSTL